MLDRKRVPNIHEIKSLKLPKTRAYRLSNGIAVHEINMGTQDILKLEIIFEAGRPVELGHSIARATATMLKEGTKQRTGAAIAEFFDFYGASIGTPYNLDTASFTLYSLSKHLEVLLPMVAEILTEASFPKEELTSLITRYQQRLQVDLSRADVVAYRQFTELIYGSRHPYGYNSSDTGFQALQRDNLLLHYQNHFHAGNCTIIISGKLNASTDALLERYLGQLPRHAPSVKQIFPTIPTQAQKIKIPHSDRSQSAIRIGRALFNRHHPDFLGMYVLSTLLGGYFGSRLMMNIREKKGYSYGIHSSLDSMRYHGFLYIGTEVGNEFTGATLKEIYKEIRNLREIEAGAEELQMLRNYLMGTLLNALDGPFNVSELVRTLVLDKLPFSYFQDLVHTILHISPKQLQQLAQTYLQEEDLWEVIVGENS